MTSAIPETGISKKEDCTMKKILTATLVLAAAILAGCSKNILEIPETQQTFTACIGDITKTTLNGGKVCWEAGDEILVNGVSFLATPDSQDPTKANFRKTNPEDPDAKPDTRGVYVATFGCTLDSETGKGILPGTVTFSNSGNIQAPMIAKSTTTELSFKNICSVLEVTLKGTETIQRIEFTANGKALSGEFTVPDGSTAVMSGTYGAAVLDFGAGIKLDSKGSVFHIAVPAGSYSGLNIKVTDTGCRAWQKTAGKTATTAVNTIYKLSFTPSFPSVVDGALSGVYTVDAKGTKVNFAKGNLYHTPEKGWYFADSQTEMPGAEWSDIRPVTHFYWSEDPAVAATETYDMDHDDTGTETFFTNKSSFKIYGNSNWRALSTQEWEYLLNGRKFTETYTEGYTTKQREVSGDGYSYLRVILKSNGVYGLLLFPDGFTGQKDIMLEKVIPEGCAFLPASGVRLYGKEVGENTSGAYWTPTAEDIVAQAMTFGVGGVSTGINTSKFYGLSIRLVADR